MTQAMLCSMQHMTQAMLCSMQHLSYAVLRAAEFEVSHQLIN